jgi:hypothetical protein
MPNLEFQDVATRVPRGVGLGDMTRLLSVAPDKNDPGMQERRIILDILLTAAVSLSKDVSGKPVAETSIWAREASNRSMSFLHLMLLLERSRYSQRRAAQPVSSLVKVACTLAGDYRTLMDISALGFFSCDVLLTRVVSALTTIFGVETGRTELVTNIQSAKLEAPRRAALVLLVSEMAISVLKRAAEMESGGRLTVSLLRTSGDFVTLTVETPQTSGFIFSSSGYEIISRLAGILSSELVYREGQTGTTMAELRFSCPSSY